MKLSGKVILGLFAACTVGFQGCYGARGGVATTTGPVTGGTGLTQGSELRVLRDVAMDRAWEAAKTAARELQLTVLTDKTQKNAGGGVLTMLNARGELVVIHVERKSERATEIRIRVGRNETEASRHEAELVYERMKLRL